jgi:hypothetical protein
MSYIHRDEAQQRRQSLERESRDEILVKVGELEAQKRVLIALQAGEPSKELVNEFKALKASLSQSNTELAQFANTTETLRQKCLISRIRAKATNSSNNEDCSKYAEQSSSASDEVDSNTELFACVQDLDFQINSFNRSREALNQTAVEIENQIEALKDRLARADVKFSHLARDAQHAADTQDQLDSKWLSFSFNSKTYQRSSESTSSQTSSRIAASFGASGGFWSAGASYSRSKSRSESQFQASMNSAETVVSGELLRVTIQRPWFRPSLFKSTQFQIRHDQLAKISPGHLEGEENFINTITQDTYLLPEYATGLLLSRNVNVEFLEISAAQAARAVRTSSSSSFSVSGGFGFWKASVSGGRSSSSSHRTFSAESSSNGLRISIPGAQIIGYYTQVMPKFPPEKKNE